MDALAPPDVRIPYYGPYVQFARMLELLKEKGVPARIKTSTLVEIGVLLDIAGRLVSGLKGLSWVDEDYRPTSELRTLVDAYGTDAWMATLRKALERAYRFLPANWESLTPESLHKVFVSHLGRDIEAVRSAETFFLTAAKYAGIPLSSAFIGRTSRAVPRTSFGQPKRPDAQLPPGETKNELESQTEKNRPIVQLLDLIGLLDDPAMGSREKDAVLTLLAYLRKRSKL